MTTFVRAGGASRCATESAGGTQAVNSANMDSDFNDLVSGINARLSKDGSDPMTGNLNMNGFSLSNWEQAEDVIFNTGVNLTITGQFQGGNGDFTGDLDVANTVTADFLTAADTVTTENLTATVGATITDLTIFSTSEPTGSADSGDQGMIRYDSNYIYLAVGPDTWKRAALSSF